MSENQFGKYELQARLAAGGMAEIFKARLPVAAGISKAVVIKRILPAYAANKQFIQMFTNEARIVMGLSHGNIAQVFDFGEIEGDWFIAMEYIDGQPLSKVIKRSRTVGIQAIPTTFAVAAAIDVLKGLHYAHTRLDDEGKPLKIVHRDVSPQNVLVSYEGQVKLVDFGIAKAKTAGREETETGAVKGKYSYFSPEQARGKELDARTDVFSAGIVLYEMLCGQLPFQGRMIDTMSRIVKGQFARPRELNPDVPGELEALILTAMAHEKDKRYPTAEAFHGALSSWLHQNAPSFQASALGTFVEFLFEPDLVAEGRPVKLPREFLEQVPRWKKPLPQPPPEAHEQGETAWGRDPAKSAARKPAQDEGEQPLTGESVTPRGLTLKAKAGVAAAALLAGLSLALGGHALWAKTGTFALEVTSTPSGAAIFIDGAPVSKLTPALLELDATSPHRLGLTLTGRHDWSDTVKRERGERATVHAELKAVEAPPPAEVGAPRAGAPKAAPVMQLAWPERLLWVDARAHAVKVPRTKAAKLKLRPDRTYKLSTEGKASLGRVTTTEVGFYAIGPGISAAASFGQLGPKSGASLRGASMLYVFMVDETPADNSGAIKVKAKDTRGAVASSVEVNAVQHAIALAPDERLTYRGLEAASTYQLRVLDREPGPRTRGDRGGGVPKVLCAQDDGLRLLEAGKTYRVRGTASLSLWFPDDDAADNVGGLELELSQ